MTFSRTLISVEDLHNRLTRHPALAEIIVFDCRFSLGDAQQGRRKYDDGHLPQAIYVHLDDELAGKITDQTGRHPLPDANSFSDKLQRWGVDQAHQVVVYDDAGGAIAARMWWMLRWMGHQNVALLDGGYPAWVDAGLPVSTKVPEISVRPTDTQYGARHSMQVEIGQLIAQLEAGTIRLVDARNAVRYAGKDEPIDPVAGHVPGAENLPFEGNLDADGFFLTPDRLRHRFGSIFEPRAPGKKEIVHMCGSGVTACHNILAMEIAGIFNTRLYVGSWSEWIRDPDRPVVSSEDQSGVI